MKILMINVCCGTGSTGRICTDLAQALEQQGHEVKIAYGRDEVPEKYQKYAVRIGSGIDAKIHGLKARLLDGAGFGSKQATIRFVEWIKCFDPDIIHLHNIHGYYINVEVLFSYLKQCGKRMIWTLHDCWAFTGHAPYCDMADCEKWRTGCSHCHLLKEYPRSFADRSSTNWEQKRRLFTGIPGMTIVTPSQWLQSLVKESFLKEYTTKVIHNGINVRAFYPRNSHLLERYGIKNQFVLLGVSSIWDNRKCLSDYLELSQLLDEDFRMVLVGLTQKQIQSLPEKVIGIQRTESIDELAMLYSEADLFLNLSCADNYPTVNIEALACGTPVLTYDTGGSPEIVRKYGGIVVEKKNIQEVKRQLTQAKKTMPEVTFHAEENDVSFMIQQYLQLYQ